MKYFESPNCITEQEMPLGEFFFIKKRRTAQLSEYFHLSARETEAVVLFSAGHTIASMAIEMNISVNTVETYRRRIFRKIGVSNVTEAVALITAFYVGADIYKKTK